MKSVVLLSLALLLMQDVRLAEVHGEVRDMHGRPVAGASVVYTRAADNKTYNFKTDTNGRYDAIGLLLGWYTLVITGPAGKHIYSGKKFLSAGEAQKFNITQIDPSVIPPKASLVPFKGPRADELQGARQKYTEGKELSPGELTEVRTDNALIGQYNELLPDTQAAIKDQDWKRAAELLKQLIAIAPYKWELYQNLGVIERSLGQYREAAAAFEHGSQVLKEDPVIRQDHGKLNPPLAMMKVGEGEALIYVNNVEGAAAQFRAATELDPKLAIAFLHLCTAEYNNDHGDAAIAACSRAISIEPDHGEGYQILATVQLNLDRQQDAIRTYEKGISVATQNMQAARPSMKSNINSQHQADPSRAIAEAVRAGQMMQSLGNIYFQLRNYRKAADLFSQSATLHPYPALPLFNLCATLFDMRNFSASLVACDRAIESDPRSADAYFVKAASIYGETAQKGRLKAPHDAVAALEKYLQLAPNGFYAGEARAMLKEISQSN